MHRVKSLYIHMQKNEPENNHAKTICENFKGNRNDLIDGKNAKCSLAKIDVIHCLRNTVSV